MFSNSGDLPKATNAEERKRNIQNASKLSSEVNNPCLKELELSYKCLSQNDYDKESCKNAFKNYKACQDFWTTVKSDRRVKGIRPLLPRPEERDAIKAEYMAKFHAKK